MTDATPGPAETEADLGRLRGSIATLGEVIEQLLMRETAAPVPRCGLRIARLA